MTQQISPIFLDYNNHIQSHGANVAFHKSPYEIYQFLKKCGVCTSKQFNTPVSSSDEFTPTTCTAVVNEEEVLDPITCAAIVSSEKADLYPSKRDTKHVRRPGKRNNKYKLCQSDHHSFQCPHRGEEWSPIYLRQRVAKHTAMYPNEKPDPAFINQSPPLLKATTKSFTRKADVTILDETEKVFEDAVEEIEEDIEPEIKMADFDNDEYRVTSDGLVRY